jgi:hypothetical protein
MLDLGRYVVALLLFVGLASAASGVTLNPGAPLNNGDSIAFDNGAGVTGTVTLVNVPADLKTVTLQVSLDGGSASVSSIGFAVNGECAFPTFLNCPGTGGSFGSNVATGTVDATGSVFSAATIEFTFDSTGNGDLDGGEITDEFFVTFPSAIDITTGSGTNGVALGNFMFALVGGGTYDFQVEFVPEPTTALLVGLGLVGFSLFRRRPTRP